jgi:hypothetical protein
VDVDGVSTAPLDKNALKEKVFNFTVFYFIESNFRIQKDQSLFTNLDHKRLNQLQ